jgi:hypothetical protein
MSGQKKGKKPERAIFESIRKPTAPPTRQIDLRKPVDKLIPSGRKNKHRGKLDVDNDSAE